MPPELLDPDVAAAIVQARHEGFLVVGPGGDGDVEEFLRWAPAREAWERDRHGAGFAAVEVDAISYPGGGVVTCTPPPGGRTLPPAVRARTASLLAGRLDDSFAEVDFTSHKWSTEQMDLKAAVELARELVECERFA